MGNGFKNIEKSVKNVKKSVSYITTDDLFLRKMYRKISQEKGYDVLKELLEDSISDYRNSRKNLKNENINTKEYDEKVSDITSKLNYVPVDFE